ncbi:hypothetical protein [Clostridium drakei]|uniref:Uncharacterized protein n=1 Tax=Clostridium drakei TaxID=332101 RepID=A0A2U8DLK3_9CLOT|nr:hypothetical protein [Clostridium drakei]AWI03553.1 hypothetical protein B9W14_03335 [Clostridium drakei]
MKSKKILASLMALSIIGSSSFVLGGSAKAATLNSKDNNYVSYASVKSFSADISRSGYLIWDDVNAFTYSVSVVGDQEDVEAYIRNRNHDHSIDLGNKINKAGMYSITVTANGLRETLSTHFNVYYNGSTFSRV